MITDKFREAAEIEAVTPITIAHSDRTSPIVAYKLSRPSCGGWMYAGITPEEVAKCVQHEIEMSDGVEPEAEGDLLISPYMTTLEEIDALPDFGGW